MEISLLNHREEAVATAVQQLMRLSYQVEADLLGSVDFFPLRRIVSHIQNTPAAFWGIYAAKLLVATAEVEQETPPAFNIASLVVHPAHFRQGLATALLQHIIASVSPAPLTVSTGRLNAPALALYAAHGFVDDHYWATADGLDMVTLRRDSPTAVTPQAPPH